MRPGELVRVEIRAIEAPFSVSVPGKIVAVNTEGTRALVRVSRGAKGARGFGGLETWVRIPSSLRDAETGGGASW